MPHIDNSAFHDINSEIRISMHKELLKVRIAELMLAERYKAQEMRTPTHFGVGQEAIAVGVCAALSIDDVVYSHHRSHNHFLAKGGSIYRLAAELFGRVTGCSKGRGGSVHLTDLSCGFIASSAILGQSMAAATGSALSFKMDADDRIATAFFGDAVSEEGAFYESLNFAALHNLPVLYVCENNGYATESPFEIRQPQGSSISQRVSSFNIPTLQADGNDVEAVYRTAQQAISMIRSNGGPVFLEFETYRWLEHVGPYFDHELGREYRSKEELQHWQKKCPVLISEAQLKQQGLSTSEELSLWLEQTKEMVLSDIEKAYKDPWPKPEELFENN